MAGILDGFLIFTIFLIAVNASIMFMFPAIFDQTNEQIVTKLIPSLTVSNLQQANIDFSGSDLQTFQTTEQAMGVSKSSGDTDSTLATRGTADFDSAQQTVLGFFNLASGYINIMLYFGLPLPWIYTITAIFGFFQLLGAFYFFQLILGTFAGIVRSVV